MAASAKRQRQDDAFTLLIRICDAFVRTPVGIISPIIKAKASVRVFYRLQGHLLERILRETGGGFGLELTNIFWRSLNGHSHRDTEGNIFIEYKGTKPLDTDTFALYKNQLEIKLLKESGIRNVLIHRVEDQKTVPQPLITEIDYRIHKVTSTYQRQLPENGNLADTDLYNIQTQLAELHEAPIQVAVFSHNGVGKSFLLNMLLLLTEENQGELEANGMKKIQTLQGIDEHATIRTVKDDYYTDLPEAIQDFIKDLKDDDRSFKNTVKSICHELRFTNREELRKNADSFRNLGSYFTDQKRINIEPFLLPQKEACNSYHSTTKCIFNLRYGASFQMRVDYLEKKQIQNQLFELKFLELEMRTNEIDNSIKEMAFESLKARASVLTEYDFCENEEHALRDILCTITHPEDVKICKDVEAFAGKTEIYLGKGGNAAEERLALQKLLQEFTLQNENPSDLMCKKIAAIKSIVVYVPSKLLHSGIDILEMPGTNHSDPLAFSFIQDALDTADVLLLLSESAFTITGQEVKYILKNSGFFKNWIKDSQEYKLMFLSYPEKYQNFQFGKDDLEKLQKMGGEEERKRRRRELHELSRIMIPNTLPPNMERNVVTSSILPVLYTSIHAQEGMPHKLVEEYATFLQYTGVKSLFVQLDNFVLEKKKFLLEELENKLTDFEKKKWNELNEGPQSSAGCSPQKPDIKQESFLKKNEDLFDDLKKTQEKIINDTINSKLKDLMLQFTGNAIRMWAENESKITDSAIFNPEYKGKHTAFKVKIHDVLFGDLAEKLSPVFQQLIEELKNVFEQYKEKTIALFRKELNVNGRPSAEKIGGSLEFALNWFLGVRRSSLNEQTLRRSFEDKFKECLIKHILEPAYTDSIENTKKRMESQITIVSQKVKELFLKNILSLYNERWPKNLARYMVRACVPISRPECTFCGKISCSICMYMETTSTFISSRTGNVYNITERLSCVTSHVIYLITCKKCKMQYVGKTSNSIRRRFVDHLSTINCKKALSLPQHFHLPGHSTQDIALTVIERVRSDQNLQKREMFWIQELDTLRPNGLNVKSK
ncbi:uncharacterized protein LOC108698046 [Xenopus laevis]|uniref:Uncharacterized protein LOC108698046 n=2 Tax=Xenopus laevis TaxID=8355 RepID=A0A1L8HTF8_XENLA|nr:uncharacterized protein LOC108698046 [Xenopus laevis]OCT99382.1 hypothetical protein XELAEV_18005160mg [Xenopus laevis]